ncbi:MAG: diadenylate cyclase CdaA [Bacillota bacterium]
MAVFEVSPGVVLKLVLDVGLVVVIAYGVFTLIRGTRAVQLLKGLFVLAVLTGVGYKLDLRLLNWTLDKVWTMAFVAVPIVFQPEIRRMLEKLGQGAPFSRLVGGSGAKRVIRETAAAVVELSRARTGALLVFERQAGLREYTETGTILDAAVSQKLLLTLFDRHAPLHDGAVIIRGERLTAAGCYLPLAAQHGVSPDLGTRHRAAVGLSEQTDALVVVVSEENGGVSIAEEGRLLRLSESKKTESVLKERLLPEGSGKRRPAGARRRSVR